MQCGSQCYCDIVISSDSKNKSFRPINILTCPENFTRLEGKGLFSSLKRNSNNVSSFAQSSQISFRIQKMQHQILFLRTKVIKIFHFPQQSSQYLVSHSMISSDQFSNPRMSEILKVASSFSLEDVKLNIHYLY